MKHQRGERRSPLVFRLTGQVAVLTRSRVVDARLLFGRQGRVVLAMLVLERHRPVSRDELADLLWPAGPPRTWKPAVRGTISKVRTFLSAAGLPDSISFDGAYRLHLPGAVEVDIESAHSAGAAARRALDDGRPDRAIGLAEQARDIAAQPFVPDMEGAWLDEQRVGLREVRLEAQCVLGEAYSRRGLHGAALREVERAVALEPFREHTYRLLMRTHLAAGNPAEAVRAYHRCRTFLTEELGVEPGSETAALHLQLLRAAPAVGPAPVGVAR